MLSSSKKIFVLIFAFILSQPFFIASFAGVPNFKHLVKFNKRSPGFSVAENVQGEMVFWILSGQNKQRVASYMGLTVDQVDAHYKSSLVFLNSIAGTPLPAGKFRNLNDVIGHYEHIQSQIRNTMVAGSAQQSIPRLRALAAAIHENKAFTWQDKVSKSVYRLDARDMEAQIVRNANFQEWLRTNSSIPKNMKPNAIPYLIWDHGTTPLYNVPLPFNGFKVNSSVSEIRIFGNIGPASDQIEIQNLMLDLTHHGGIRKGR